MGILVAAFALFCFGSFTTYYRPFRESSLYLPSFILTSLVGGWLWVTAARRCQSSADLIYLSLCWDGLMAAAYYAGPLLVVGNGVGWQAWCAVALVVCGLVWFKMATG
jgi:hypothetical protein